MKPATSDGQPNWGKGIFGACSQGGRWLSLAAVSAMVLGTALSGAAPQEKVTSFRELEGLQPEEALQGRPVQIRGVVLSYDLGWGQLYVHDGAKAKYFSALDFHSPLEPGQSVEITGITTLADGFPKLTNQNLVVLGRQALPAAAPHEVPDLAKDYGEWVQTSGEVRVADTSRGRLALVLGASGQSCLVFVLGTPGTNDHKWLIGATVQVRGINASTIVKGQLVSALLNAPGLGEVKIVKPAGAHPASLPVTAIDALLHRELGGWTKRAVHLNGVVTAYKPTEYIEIEDPTGVIHAQIVQATRVQRDERVDLWGFLDLSGTEAMLKDAYFELLQGTPRNPIVAIAGNAPSDANAEEALTNASQVVRLSREKAAQQLAVRLRGVVTYADPDWRNGFLHDASGEIYFDSAQADVRAGQWVELAGQTSAGGFAPEVVSSAVRILGTSNLPPAVKVDLEELANGHLDAHWVEMEGVVRSVTEEEAHVTISLMTRKGRFKALIPNYNHQPVPLHLIDALVAVRGACGSQMNARGQLSGITLHVPGLDQITVLEAMPSDPFSGPPRAILTVATFDPEHLAGRRVKVSGIVTLVLADRGFFLQDETGGIRVNSSRTAELNCGDRVDVLAFPSLGDFSPCLEEATWRKTGSLALPAPKRTTAEEILVKGINDSLLVEIEAQLSQNVARSAHQKLVLQDGPIIFTAQLNSAGPGEALQSLTAGSIVRVRGICAIQGNEEHNPNTFRLLLASARDVEVLKSPSWWTLQRTLTVTAGLGLGIIATLVWVGSLRRRVKAQTEVIRLKHKELIEISRQAGMAEVATAVLHNVGNVLNSVNVSANLMAENLRQSKAGRLSRLAALVRQHDKNLEEFLAADPKGKRLPEYLSNLGEVLLHEQHVLLEEAGLLQKNVDHIRDIVAMQQSYAKVIGVAEALPVEELVEDALRMNAGAIERHGLKVVREYDPHLPVITVERHKVLQILVNVIRNAKYACDESNQPDKHIIARVTNGDGRVKISIIDNGVGIPQENLTRIFNHGFTTRKDGHGFGLHNGALIAHKMGGSLRAQSPGVGKGAVFTLELPVAHDN